MTRRAFLRMTGEWIVEQREALGLTQAEIATAAGASESSVSNWEQGRSEMGSFAYERLQSFFRARRALQKGVTAPGPAEGLAQEGELR